MYKLWIHVVGMIAFLMALDATAAADTGAHEQIIIEITLSENTASTGEKKILAEPKIAVTLGTPFSFHVGGERDTRIGTRVRGTVNEHQSDSLLVAFKLAVGRAVIDAHALDTDLVRTEVLDLRTTMIVGARYKNAATPKWREIRDRLRLVERLVSPLWRPSTAIRARQWC